MNAWPETLPVPLATPQMRSSPRAIQMEMESRRIRKRRTAEVPLDIMSLQWNFTEDQFADFKTFFDETLNNGAGPFIMEIFGVGAQLSFVEGSYAYARSDNLVAVSASVIMSTVFWILSDGTWVDAGQWMDTEFWNE